MNIDSFSYYTLDQGTGCPGLEVVPGLSLVRLSHFAEIGPGCPSIIMNTAFILNKHASI